MVRKIAGLAVFMVIGLFACFSLMAEEGDTAALKTRVLSKLKACGCETSLLKCGDCPVAIEIKDYVDKLIEAKVPEDKMLGNIEKSFSGEVVVDENSKEDAAGQLEQALPPGSPHLVADVMTYDFGKVSKKTTSVNHEFTLRNAGKGDLVIQNLRASCSCAKVSLRTASSIGPDFDSQGSGPGWTATIKPGEMAVLEIVLDMAAIPAGDKPISREAYVLSNDPMQSLAVFKVSLEVTNS